MISKLKPYPEYKESGVPWLEAVPKHWVCLPHRALFKEIKDQGYVDEPLLSVTIKKGVIRQEELLSETSKKDSSNLDKAKYKLVIPNDITYNKMRAWQGAIGVSRYRGIVSPAYIVVRLRSSNNPQYFHYLFRTLGFAKEAERWSYGITSDQWSLRAEHFKMIYSCVPSREEQNKLVWFIRYFDAKINRFIRKRRRLIELLGEYKQAIINQYVTGKIDPRTGKPYPRYKPSGVDWIGVVPEHWNVKKLKHLVSNVNEQTATRKSGEVYIALENVESWTGKINFPDSDVEFDSQVKRFNSDDILFGKLRPYLAKVTRPKIAGVCVGEFLVLSLLTTELVSEFLENQLRCKLYIDIINSSTFGARMPRADWTFIGNMPIVYPMVYDEQIEIINKIKEKTASLQSVKDQAQREIDLIREYGTRLIADVVTGKVDVRAVALPEAAADEEELLNDAAAEMTEDEIESEINQDEGVSNHDD